MTVGQPVDPAPGGFALLGDRWTLLILQSVFLRVRRYDALRARLGISPAALADRLRALVAAGVLARRPYRAANRTQDEYRLTARGLPLWRLLVAIWTWEARWVPGRSGELPLLAHTGCGAATTPVPVCGHCSGPATAADVTATRRGTAPVAAALGATRPTRKNLDVAGADPMLFFPTTMELLGDRWSAGILTCALAGDGHFTEFQRELGIGPSVLSARLRRLVDLDVLHTAAARTRTDANAYLLTAKGAAFLPALAVIVDWAGVHDLTLCHRHCGRALRPEFGCAACGARLARTTVRVQPR